MPKPIDEEILDALRPIITRLAKEDPDASKEGFFLDLFLGIGIGAGQSDGLTDEAITLRVEARTKEMLAEARK